MEVKVKDIEKRIKKISRKENNGIFIEIMNENQTIKFWRNNNIEKRAKIKKKQKTKKTKQQNTNDNILGNNQEKSWKHMYFNSI